MTDTNLNDDGRDEHGHLRADAHTAFRLSMDADGRAPLATLLATWNILGRYEDKKVLADLPADITRIGGVAVCDTALEPLALTFDQAVADAFHLSAKHRQPDADGWHQMSNVVRVLKAVTGGRDPRTIGSNRARLVDGVRDHPLVEVREGRNDLQVRPRNAAAPMVAVTTAVTCPGDAAPRMLAEHAAFGSAFRALLRADASLVADGTVARFSRDGEEREARWSQARRAWLAPDGRPLRRTDPTDPVTHHYANGHMVETMVGFVSVSRSGRHFANVGIPHDSEGDDDAYVQVVERAEAPDEASARALLGDRDDLDHVLPGVTRHDGQMGFWLTAMGR